MSVPSAYNNTGGVTPVWLNKGDNAWQLIAGTLVGLQSVPGLVILYGSIVKKKWAVNSAFMAFYAFAAVLLCWVIWAYKMSFGDKLLPFWGKAGPVVTHTTLLNQAILPATVHYHSDGTLESPALAPLYSYTVGAFSLWGGGFLFQWGVIDYSGGYVIHLSSGVGGFVAAFWVRFGSRLAVSFMALELGV
jgi:Amt family ammonium transporter